MTSTTTSSQGPVPIHRIAHHYYLYSAPAISQLRATHSIPGTLIGTLPQCPQQNVFLGLPILLSYSETRRLVTIGAAYIVDDVAAHRNGLSALGRGEKMRWMMRLKEEGMRVAKMQEETKKEESRVAMAKELERLKAEVDSSELKGEKKERVLRKLRRKEEEQREEVGILDRANEDADLTSTEGSTSREATPSSTASTNTSTATADDDESLFDTPTTSRSATPSSAKTAKPQTSHSTTAAYTITPTLSTPPLPTPIPSDHHERPPLPTPATALHAYMHSQSYFLLPGLRFGSHFNAYPGDPLRFHAHFLCRAYEWEEEIEVMELVGGGRLGTGVKKGFLIGGPVSGVDEGGENEEGDDGKDVRCFCIEWGGM